MIGYDVFPTWRIFNILFVLCGFIVISKVKLYEVPFEFMFLFGLFMLWILFQFAFVLVEDRFGIYEPFYLISLFFLVFLAFFLHVLLYRETKKTIETIQLSLNIMVAYQIFQFLAFFFGFPQYCHILNQFDIEKITIFYKIVGTLMGPPSFLSESGMFALFLGPMLAIFILFDHFNIYKPNKKIYFSMFIGLALTLSGGAFLEFIFLGILIFVLNIKKVSLTQYALIVGFLTIVTLLILNNPGYQVLIFDRFQSLFTGKSGRFEGYRQIMDIYFDGNLLFGIGPKSGRYFNADQNMLLPMLLTDHGLIGTFLIALIFALPYFLVFTTKSRPIFLIPYTGFLIHLFLAYGTFMWSYLWIIYIFILFGMTYKPESGKNLIVSI